MPAISLLFEQSNLDTATTVANAFKEAGYSVYAGPKRIAGFDTLSTPAGFFQKRFDAYVILMDLGFYHHHRAYFDQLALAAESSTSKIQIASLDSKWGAVRSDAVSAIKDISYFQEVQGAEDERDDAELAEKLVSRVANALEKTSHLNRTNFLNFIQAAYDPVKEVSTVYELSGRISYSIFDCVHTGSGAVERYLVLYPGATISAILEYLENFEPDFRKGCDKLFVVRSEPARELSKRQKQTIEDQFRGTPIRFETIVSNRRIRKATPQTLLEKGEFLVDQNWLRRQGEQVTISTTTLLDQCCYDDHEIGTQRKLVILNGEGGGGKTHTVRHLHDRLVHSKRNVFFLSGEDIYDASADYTIRSLYDIYKGACRADGGPPVVSREMFDLNFSVNDPVIIVDGLEEIITMMGERFDLNRFYEDCIEKISGDANGRIIITTRQSTWPGFIDEFVQAYTLSSFTDQQARSFFESAFGDESVKVSLAMQILEGLGEKEGLPPLVCDLIRNELLRSAPLPTLQAKIHRGDYSSSTGLKGFLKDILNREDKLGIRWPPDATLEALSNFAKESVSGPVALFSAIEIMEQAFPERQREGLEESVKNFILFRHYPDSNSVSFRYDFVLIVFLADYVFNTIERINVEELESAETAAIFAHRLVPGSDIVERIVAMARTSAADGFLSIIEELIRDILSGKLKAKSEHQARIIASNLLFLRLAVDDNVRTLHDSTSILKSIYASSLSDANLENVSIIRFAQDSGRKYKFNFESSVVRNGWFDGVALDDIVRADERTVFAGCVFRNCLSSRVTAKTSLWKARFESIREEDSAFEAARIASTKTLEATEDRKRDELKRFFKCFASGHSFAMNRELDTLHAMFKPRIGRSAEQLVELLIARGIVEAAPGRGSNYVQVAPQYRLIVRKFVLDSIVSPEIESVIGAL